MLQQGDYETVLQENQHLSAQLKVAVHALKRIHSEASAITGDMLHVDESLADNLVPLNFCAATAADAIREIAVVEFNHVAR